MATTEELTTSLKRYNLTDYEAKVLNAIINQDKSTATELSISSKVPRTRIYDILSTLARKGWIEILHENPTKYTCVDIQEIEAKLKKIEADMKKTNKMILDELKSNLKDENSLSAPNSIELFLDKKETVKDLSTSILLAKERIWLYDPRDILIDEIFDDLVKAKKKGIKIRIMFNDSAIKKSNTKRLKANFDVKIHQIDYQHCNILIDYDMYANLYHRKNDIQSNRVNYKKCIYCLSAWMDREWDNLQ